MIVEERTYTAHVGRAKEWLDAGLVHLDDAIAALSRARTGVSVVAVAQAFGELCIVEVDSSGNRSLTNTVKSFFTAFATLTVRANGPSRMEGIEMRRWPSR